MTPAAIALAGLCGLLGAAVGLLIRDVREMRREIIGLREQCHRDGATVSAAFALLDDNRARAKETRWSEWVAEREQLKKEWRGEV